MRRFMTRDPRAYGGYPLDSDLDQMTDDGCPLAPDPARWADPEWRDNPEGSDTFDASSVVPATLPPAGARPIVRVIPGPPRSSEGSAGYHHTIAPSGRFRALGEVLALILVCTAVGYVCSGWALGGWLALGASLFVLVGRVLELVHRRGVDKLSRDLLTDRWDHDLSSAPINRPRTRPTLA